MPKGRGYQQYCPMATALDTVGDRWALLVVRELILGPRRFGELAAGLSGIGTDILTARLRSLEEVGVLRRRGKGRQQRYELTERGRALRPVLVELGRWGANLLDLPASPDDVMPRVGLTALVLDPRPIPADASGLYDIATGKESVRVVAHDGQLSVVGGEDADCSPLVRAAITLTQGGLLGLLVGASAPQLARDGDLFVVGDRRGASRLLSALAAPSVLAGLSTPGDNPLAHAP